MWLAGNADLGARAGHRLSAAAARIDELLPPEEEEAPRSRGMAKHATSFGVLGIRDRHRRSGLEQS